MAVQSSLKNNCVVGAGALLLAACATPAPPLPPDTTSVNARERLSDAYFTPEDLAMDCKAIETEHRAIVGERQVATGTIEENRGRNQAAGYFGAFFLLPLAAVETNQTEKEAVKKGYERQDTLLQLAAYKHCP